MYNWRTLHATISFAGGKMFNTNTHNVNNGIFTTFHKIDSIWILHNKRNLIGIVFSDTMDYFIVNGNEFCILVIE